MEKMALAELPQASKREKWPLRNFRKRQNGENGSCGTSASIKMGKMALAELPQASKWRKWRLRNFRKRQNGENGVCGTSASVKMGKMALAELPQASKWEKWPLRSSRKRQKVFRGTCGVPANTKKFSVALAGVPQTPKSFSRDLRDSRKRQKVFRGTCRVPASISKSDLPPFDVRFLAIAWGCTKKQGLRCRIASPALSISEKPTHRRSGARSSCHLFHDLNHRRTHLNGVAGLDENAANSTSKVGRDVVLHLHGFEHQQLVALVHL